MPMTTGRSKSKPEVEFQYSGRSFLPRDAAMLARSWQSYNCPSVLPSVYPSATRVLCD